MSADQPAKKSVDTPTSEYLFANLAGHEIHFIRRTKDFDELISVGVQAVTKNRVIGKCKTDLKTALGNFQFELQGEMYLFEAKFEQNGDSISLESPFQIYQLQRREDFRLPVPENGPVKLILQNPDRTKSDLPTVDICSGGAKIICPKESAIKLGETYQCELDVEDEDPVPVKVRVQHIKDLPSAAGKVEIGVHFVNLSEKEQNNIYRLVVLLYRKLYLRGLQK